MSDNERVWVLGASDFEMSAIEAVLVANGERVAYALCGGKRVHAGVAYRGDGRTPGGGQAGAPETWMLVECSVPVPKCVSTTRIDHHFPGDPGYGRPPREFLTASSLGQVPGLVDVYGDPERGFGGAYMKLA